MYNKIKEIKNTGTLKMYENIKKNTKHHNNIKEFEKIWGIGPVMAKEFINKKIYTINNLKKQIKKKKIQLTEQQLIGLKYYKNLSTKISRKEITECTKYLKKLLKIENLEIYNGGSYRLGKKESGDIDIIITTNDDNIEDFKEKVLKILEKEKIIKNILVKGKEKDIYVVKFPEYNKFRQMDVAFIEKKYLPWYLLYFGSSKDFSKKIRGIASKKGYKLNEKGIFYKNTGKRIDFNPIEEKEIFEFLEIPYIKPKNR